MHLDMGDSLESERRGSVQTLNIRSVFVLTAALGVSLITQMLYALVFCSRYLDLFWANPTDMPWNFILKLFYIGSSFYIIALMMRVFARTREKETAWKMGSFCLGGSAAAAPLVLLIFKKWHHYNFHEVRQKRHCNFQMGY